MRPRALESIGLIRMNPRALLHIHFIVISVSSLRALLTLKLPSYTDNGGSTLAIAGAEFAVMAGDTRLTSGYSINSRHHPKLFKIGGTTADQKDATIVLSVVGFAADGEAL